MEAAFIRQTNRTIPSVDSKNSVECEQTLVAAAKGGSQIAFQELVKRYEQRVFRVARTVAQSDADAEEIMQDAFVNAFKNLCYFRGDSRFYTWLVRITINAGLMRLRRRRLHVISIDDLVVGEEGVLLRELEDCGPTPEECYLQEELQQILETSIRQLRPAYRRVFELRDVEGFSAEETACALQISVSAVKSRLGRARIQLRHLLLRYLLRCFKAAPKMNNFGQGSPTASCAAIPAFLEERTNATSTGPDAESVFQHLLP